MRLFLGLLFFRALNAHLLCTAFAPDEQWQSLEIAYRFVFGTGHFTWEWDRCHALRSWLHPLLFIGYYYCVQAVTTGPFYAYLNAYGAAAANVLLGSRVATFAFSAFSAVLPKRAIYLLTPRWLLGAVEDGGGSSAVPFSAWLENYLVAYGPRVYVQSVLAAATDLLVYRIAEHVFLKNEISSRPGSRALDRGPLRSEKEPAARSRKADDGHKKDAEDKDDDRNHVSRDHDEDVELPGRGTTKSTTSTEDAEKAHLQQQATFRANLLLVVSVFSWFNFFAMPRTYSSCLELFLNVLGVYLYQVAGETGSTIRTNASAGAGRSMRGGEQQDEDEDSRSLEKILGVAVGSLSCVVRPTAILFWLPYVLSFEYLQAADSPPADRAVFACFRPFRACARRCIRMVANSWQLFFCFVLVGKVVFSVFGVLLDTCMYAYFHHEVVQVDAYRRRSNWKLLPISSFVNFVQFNLFQDGGAVYGAHPFRWYFFDGLGAALASYLPLFVYGFYKIFPRRGKKGVTHPAEEDDTKTTTSDHAYTKKMTTSTTNIAFFSSRTPTAKAASDEEKTRPRPLTATDITLATQRRMRPLLIGFFATLIGLSFASHKEHRFLLPVTWVAHLCVAEGLKHLFERGRVCRTPFFFVFLLQIGLAVFFAFFHQRGGDKVLSFLREEVWSLSRSRNAGDGRSSAGSWVKPCQYVGQDRSKLQGKVEDCVVTNATVHEGRGNKVHAMGIPTKDSTNGTATDKSLTVFFATDCHAMPLYSYLHGLPDREDLDVRFGFLDCSPLPLMVQNADTPRRNWRDQFVHDPTHTLDELFAVGAFRRKTWREQEEPLPWLPAGDFCPPVEEPHPEWFGHEGMLKNTVAVGPQLRVYKESNLTPKRKHNLKVAAEEEAERLLEPRRMITPNSVLQPHATSTNATRSWALPFPYQSGETPTYLVLSSALFDHSEKRERALLNWLSRNGYTLRRSAFDALFGESAFENKQEEGEERKKPLNADHPSLGRGRNFLSYYIFSLIADKSGKQYLPLVRVWN